MKYVNRLEERKMGTWKNTLLLMIRFPKSINYKAEWNSVLFISPWRNQALCVLERIWFQTVRMIILW